MSEDQDMLPGFGCPHVELRYEDWLSRSLVCVACGASLPEPALPVWVR